MDEPDQPSLPSPGELVRRYAAWAKKALGQHFLTDPSILRRIVDCAAVGPGDRVLEIGPGPGGLTRTLLERGCHVVALELDRHAVFHLREALLSDRLDVVEGDALALDVSALLARPFAAIGNLPYNSATEIFFKIERLEEVSRMCFMFQREVADRFVARACDRINGPLALLSTIRWSARLAMRLPPGAFVPRPKVHSAVVVFERLAEAAVPTELEPTYRRLVRTAFQQRRKTLRNALSGLARPEHFERAGLDSGLRPERLALSDFLGLAGALSWS